MKNIISYSLNTLSPEKLFSTTNSKSALTLPKKNNNENIRNINDLIKNNFQSRKCIDDSYCYTIRRVDGPKYAKLRDKIYDRNNK